jgi:peroxiredoxin family protein
MTMDVFGFELEDFIPGIEIAGAAGFLDFAAEADIQLFV